MGNEVHEFDLHIEVGTSWYCGDASITCEVTFPGLDIQPDITIDYDTGDESLTGAIERAVKDIAAYMEDPQDWIARYVKESSEDWRKLKAARVAAKEYRHKIASEQSMIEGYQRWLKEKEAQIALLEARIAQSEERG